MPSVLIVNTSTFSRKLYKKMFEDKNIVCLEADNGLTGLEIFLEKHNVIDLIIISQQIPEVNGFELIKWIKKIGNLMSIPVIFIPPWKDKKIIEIAKNLGIFDYPTNLVSKNHFITIKIVIESHLQDLNVSKEKLIFKNYKTQKNQGKISSMTKVLSCPYIGQGF